MPEMGMKKSIDTRAVDRSLAAALFSTTQQRVLGLLFGQPDRSFYATELITLTGGGSGAVQRELARLEQSGLVITSRQGTQKHYQANPQSPLFTELCGIARKTVGLAEPLRQALKSRAKEIRMAFVYGSVAKRSDNARSDIDLMIVSDSLDFPTVLTLLQDAQGQLGREINPTIFKWNELRQRKDEESSFVSRVLAQPKLWVFGGEHDLPA